MECNKDEAVRAKDIAEKKFAEKNYAGAKKFALKAQNLFPGLEGLSQMLTTLEVYISADNKINGESDWYAILGANPLDDDETIRKQYRKLALVLHPDKNKAVGAEGAFKLVAESWCLLSDKLKRQSYNHRRGVVSLGFQAQQNQNRNRDQNQKKNAVPKRKSETFWTICHRCKTHYEYMRMYLNHTLLCPNCHEAFVASERDPPLNVSNKPQPNWSNNSNNSNSNNNSNAKTTPNNPNPNVKSTNGAFNESAFKWAPLFEQGKRGESSSSVAASLVQRASETVKRQREEQRNSATGNNYNNVSTERPSKKIHVENNHHANNGTTKKGSNNNSEAGRFFFMPNNYFATKPNSARELSFQELKAMLAFKAKKEIGKKLKSSSNGVEEKEEEEEVWGNNNKDNKKNKEEEKSISVPDSDFHNFDTDRTEDTFKEDQVWAAYDDDDGMPRFYARVHRVISVKPFKMRISWLNSRSNAELGPLDWIGNGFTKTSGEFRVGKHEFAGGLNTFSHLVTRWEKGPRGAIRIYPQKGQVWAVYKNWSPDWDSETRDEVRHKYEMVEILEGFTDDDDKENASVSVALLDKVPGFKTVFRSRSEEESVRRFPKEELFRLSHQIPFHVLTGQEAENAPKGCFELDPAATPLELINA